MPSLEQSVILLPCTVLSLLFTTFMPMLAPSMVFFSMVLSWLGSHKVLKT